VGHRPVEREAAETLCASELNRERIRSYKNLSGRDDLLLTNFAAAL
jgi:hypothetical protein